MAFRKERIISEDVEEFGAGYHLHILRGVDVLGYDDGTGVIRFAGTGNPTLEIESLEPILEIDGTVTTDLTLLQGMRIEVATANKDGSLEIHFEGRRRLFVPFGVYEAWHLRSGDTLQIVSVAGGGIAIWL